MQSKLNNLLNVIQNIITYEEVTLAEDLHYEMHDVDADDVYTFQDVINTLKDAYDEYVAQ